MTIEKALELVKQEYEKAKTLDVIYNPVAYALFKVWKMADRRDDK